LPLPIFWQFPSRSSGSWAAGDILLVPIETPAVQWRRPMSALRNSRSKVREIALHGTLSDKSRLFVSHQPDRL